MNDIYVALDFPTWQETDQFINQNNLQGVPVKVGMELFYREGPDIIKRLKENNHKIFLDLKLHDIPTTVYRAMKNLAKLKVDIVNVHALGGLEMMQRAKEGLLSEAQSDQVTQLIAITILTSHDQHVVNEELLLQRTINDHVVHLAALTKKSGADGVVCSVHEATDIKAACGSDFLTVTPGIRLQHSNQDDQKRIATPAFAREHDADILVVGRSITQADNPYKAYKQVIEEWNHGFKS